MWTFSGAFESQTEMALSGGRRPLEPFGSLQRVFFSLLIGSSEKSFLFYLTQVRHPNKEVSEGASREGLGKTRRQKAWPL